MQALARQTSQSIAIWQTPRLAAIVCLAGILIVFLPIFAAGLDQIRTGADDFLGLYAGARLIGTPDLYDPARIRQVQIERAGVTGQSLLCTRIPAFPALLWPLARTPYGFAHAVWFLVRFGAAAAFVLVWPHTRRWPAAALCCASVPLAAALANGQDAPLLLLWLALWERWRHTRPFAAGLALSLCLAKFHLFLLIPVLLLRDRDWRVLGGCFAGAAALLSLSFAAAGWDWPVRYLRVIGDPAINPSRGLMPNLHGLLGLDGWPLVAASAVVAVAASIAIFRLPHLPALAIALAGGYLLSYHAYVADALVLIPAILIAMSEKEKIRAGFAWLLATPVPWLLLLRRAG